MVSGCSLCRGCHRKPLVVPGDPRAFPFPRIQGSHSEQAVWNGSELAHRIPVLHYFQRISHGAPSLPGRGRDRHRHPNSNRGLAHYLHHWVVHRAHCQESAVHVLPDLCLRAAANDRKARSRSRQQMACHQLGRSVCIRRHHGLSVRVQGDVVLPAVDLLCGQHTSHRRTLHRRALRHGRQDRDVLLLRPAQRARLQRRLPQRAPRLSQHRLEEPSEGEGDCAGVLRRPAAVQVVARRHPALHFRRRRRPLQPRQAPP
mmetsp:Transcript_41269/g.82959  ORF Transcript_41269/g.82959 Transcript_41269/m.82959 type:complete len:258 (-) Transcript_41269:256-1029(-)